MLTSFYLEDGFGVLHQKGEDWVVGPVENVMEIFLLVEHLNHKGGKADQMGQWEERVGYLAQEEKKVGYLGLEEKNVDHLGQKRENVRV